MVSDPEKTEYRYCIRSFPFSVLVDFLITSPAVRSVCRYFLNGSRAVDLNETQLCVLN
jgi:hypothetical protein